MRSSLYGSGFGILAFVYSLTLNAMHIDVGTVASTRIPANNTFRFTAYPINLPKRSSYIVACRALYLCARPFRINVNRMLKQ